ncbi:MAG: glycosyltransferase, partial [Anaerolineae bacterium]|nr:glycosyltransferase [Anaerolineae bacterium]
MLDLAIIIVQYNVRDLLRDCLRSVFASAGDFSYSVTVVDSCSTDGSADMVAAEFPQARLIRTPVNGGYSYANNLGLRAAGFRPLADEAPHSESDEWRVTGETSTSSKSSTTPPPSSVLHLPPAMGGPPSYRFALLLNPDTLLPPTALADMLAFMAAHPQAGAAGPRLVLADGSLDLACRRGEPTLETSFYRLT